MEFDTLSLIDIFRNEAESQGLLFEKAILGLIEKPEDVGHLESAMRAAHSLKGAAQIVGAKGISLMAHQVEECLVTAQKTGTFLKRTALNCLLEVFETLVKLKHYPDLEILNWPGEEKEKLGTLNQALLKLIAELQEETPSEPYDERFLSLFWQEFQTNVSTLASLMNTHQSDPIFDDTLIRIPHSIKGSAGIIGFGRLSKLCEEIESWFLGIKEGLWVWDTAAKALFNDVLFAFEAIAAAPVLGLGKAVLKMDNKLSQLTQEIFHLCTYREAEPKKKT